MTPRGVVSSTLCKLCRVQVSVTTHANLIAHNAYYLGYLHSVNMFYKLRLDSLCGVAGSMPTFQLGGPGSGILICILG